ncbi:MAG TPA: hypothetical protein VHO92_00405, partial [Methanobacterium sp.]|nr:hypothetical protein [Methanobacterium sp.]
MNKKILIALILVVVVIVSFGGYYAYGEYTSLKYNELLNQSDSAWLSAYNDLNQTNPETKSYETNIQLVKSAMNSTDQAISLSEQMVQIAPDKATKEYASIRLDMYKQAKKAEELYLKMFEDIQTSGIFAVLGYVDTMKKEMNSIQKNIETDNTQLNT